MKKTEFKCPHCGVIIDAAAIMGSVGGKTTGDKKRRSPEHYRKASLRRWEIARAKEGK